MITRPLAEKDYEQWLKLYHGYAEHYKVALTEEGIVKTWGWLMDEAHPLTGIVAEEENHLAGLAHFRAMPSPLRGAEIGFLDDLFVDPKLRGKRVGAVLLEEVRAIGKKNGWALIRWITRDDNYRARALYDRHAEKTDWNMYEMGCRGR